VETIKATIGGYTPILSDPTRPVLPDYSGANVCGIVPSLLAPCAGTPTALPAWFPAEVAAARQVVLLIIDGLGWEQLLERQPLVSVLPGLRGGPITTVAPSTTATALTSIATGLTPAEHGIVGYRVDFGGEVVNMLRWSSARGDARHRVPPRQTQPRAAFLGGSVPVVSRADLEHSAFTEAHLTGARHHGWRVPSNLAVEVATLLRAGESFVYAYYDGLDKVAHEFGFGEHYDSELRFVDRIVGDVLAQLPPGAVLCITADHGQVEVGDRIVTPCNEVLAATRYQSGEGRFRWFHAKRGATEALAEACSAHADVAWVVTREQVLDEHWFGASVPSIVERRLGDVAIVAREPVSFDDPADSGPFNLICRHGSLTAAEMFVPFLVGTRE
jgi:hypothetical protein